MRLYTVIHSEVEPTSSLIFNYVREENYFFSIGIRLGTSVGELLCGVLALYKDDICKKYLAGLNSMIENGTLSIMTPHVISESTEVMYMFFHSD